MRRTKWLPATTLVGFAVFMGGGYVVGLRAMQKPPASCLNGCGPKQTPAADACCKPPPCDFLYELTFARAQARSVARAGRQMRAERSATGQAFNSAGLGTLGRMLSRATDADMERFLDLKSAALKKEAPTFAKCAVKTAYLDQEPYKVDAGCNIYNAAGTMLQTVDRAKAASDRCAEVTEAAFRSAETQQAHCRAVQRERDMATTDAERSQLTPVTAGELQDLAQQMADKAVESLENSLIRFWLSCIDVKDPDAQNAARLSLDQLKKGNRSTTDRFIRAVANSIGGQP